MPVLKNIVEIIRGKPHIAERGWIMEIFMARLKKRLVGHDLRPQTEAQSYHRRKPHRRRAPRQCVSRKSRHETLSEEAKIGFLLLLSVDSVPEGISDFSGVWLAGKRGRVASAQGNAPFNLIKRACQHRAIRRAPTIATPANVNDEKAERTKA
jgi:hypothetical protein